ncbi:hypothetical protein BpHYR1_024847 [Brachionus plicatilis]|uniref:Uncharacterized protein n=1 Tax=Brachionus plicatilis TaxID=10195 RepID=A0A3M7PK60_BRAPC|nr:hypothetical protein BpHYR1_024847 [Brachionus plicatilis]
MSFFSYNERVVEVMGPLFSPACLRTFISSVSLKLGTSSGFIIFLLKKFELKLKLEDLFLSTRALARYRKQINKNHRIFKNMHSEL